MKNIKNFWDNCHTNGKTDSLSSFFENGIYYTTYERTVDYLQIMPFISKGKKILEVGVGEGYVTKGLHDAGLLVYGLDISDVALEKVKTICVTTYTLDTLAELPTDFFDIVICNHVIQHIRTSLLENELTHIVASLKKDGVFALQFVSNNYYEDTGIDSEDIFNIISGTCCRSPKFLENMLCGMGARCELVYSDTVCSGDVHGSHVFHIRK